MQELPRTERTTVRRRPQRGVYDREQLYAILDAGLVCHVGFVTDGKPYVIPTIHVRVGDRLYLHGSPASRMLQALAAGAEACVTVTLVDGLVLARSAFHHSMNYRSAIVFGRAEPVEDAGEKMRVLHALADHLIRGRWEDARPPAESELKGTSVVSLPIEEASAKVRTGPPIDDEEDYALSVWAGVLPLMLVAGEPVPDQRLAAEIAVPPYALSYRGPGPSSEVKER